MSNNIAESPPFKTFLFEYTYKGSRWSGEIRAQSFDDAKNRLHHIAHGRVSGELIAKIPAVGGTTGPLVRFLCWTRNLLCKV